MSYGCYIPAEVRPMYFLNAIQSGMDRKSVNLHTKTTKKVLAKALSKMPVELINTKTDLIYLPKQFISLGGEGKD